MFNTTSVIYRSDQFCGRKCNTWKTTDFLQRVHKSWYNEYTSQLTSIEATNLSTTSTFAMIAIQLANLSNHKGVIKGREAAKKDRQKNDKRTDNVLQNITKKTKDWATRIPLKPEGELMCSGRGKIPAPLVAAVVLLLLQTWWNNKS